MHHLNAYVGKERIHCFSVVRPVAVTQMKLSRWSGATEIKNNSALLVIRCTRRVILDFQLETEGFERVCAQLGRFGLLVIAGHRNCSNGVKKVQFMLKM